MRTSTGTASMISTACLRNIVRAGAGAAQLGMNAAGPVEHEDDRTRLPLDIGNNFMNQGLYDGFL